MDIFYNGTEVQRRCWGKAGGRREIHKSSAKRDVGKVEVKERFREMKANRCTCEPNTKKPTSFIQGGHVLLCLLQSRIVRRAGEKKR